jgi:hypothetical protein
VPRAFPMQRRWRSLGAVAVLPFMVAGCATSGAMTEAAPRSSSSSATAMPPGMSMAATARHAGPSAAARMICGAETREAVAGVLELPAPPPTKTSWSHHRYTCTYQLATGPLVLSVQDSTNLRSGRRFYDRLSKQLAHPKTIRGLASFGLPAAETTNGHVIFLKDGKTLEVDASKLPRQVGAHRRPRTDIAYAVAADVVGCWSE